MTGVMKNAVKMGPGILGYVPHFVGPYSIVQHHTRPYSTVQDRIEDRTGRMTCKCPVRSPRTVQHRTEPYHIEDRTAPYRTV